jgi:methionyl-tRNA formyltransferase
MRLLFFGTPDFAVPSLRAIHGAGHEIALVVTRPDARRGRGRKVSHPPVKRAAQNLELVVYQPSDVNAPVSVARLEQEQAQIGVVVAYGQILNSPVLSAPERGLLNVHASLLPKYRGAAPIHWAIIRGEEETGVTVQQMVEELDAGPVIKERKTPIGREETAGQLHDRLAAMGAGLIVEVLERLEKGVEPEAAAQNPDQASYAPKLSKSDGWIDWQLAAGQIHNLVRGLTPWPGARTRFHHGEESKTVQLIRVEPRSDVDSDKEPGVVVELTAEEEIVVQAGQGAVVIQQLKPASGRAMGAADFVHGHRLEPGDRFQQPGSA